MKREQTADRKERRVLPREIKEKAAQFAGLAILSALLSGAETAKGLTCFGVSALAAANGINIIPSMLGGIFGYAVFTLNSGGIRYIAQILIIAAIKWAFAPVYTGGRRWASPITCAAVSLSVGTVTLFMKESTIFDVLLVASEGIICGGASFFLERVYKIFSGREKSSDDTVALSLCAALVLCALSGVKIGMASLGHLLSALLIMITAYLSGSAGGACAGLAIGTALSIRAGDNGFMVMALGLGGMLSGLFSKSSKYAVALLFLICSLLSVAVIGTERENLYLLYEVLSAVIIFLLLPEKMIHSLKIPGITKADEPGECSGKYFASRLEFAAQSLSETSKELCSITERLARRNTETDRVFRVAADRVCRRCSQKMDCWDTMYTQTMDSFNHMIPALRQNGRLDSDTTPTFLAQRCKNPTALVGEINGAYREYLRETKAAESCRRMRDVVNAQFAGMSRLLTEMSQELSLTVCDGAAQRKIEEELHRLGITAQLVSCPVDRMGRRAAEFFCPQEQAQGIDSEALCQSLSEICAAEFSVATVTCAGKMTRVSLCEQTPFLVNVASYQKTARGEEVCGDSYERIILQNGYQAIILSDGMGSGKNAAVDSRMTVSLISRFISMGFSVENSLTLVNSALMLKEEETLSTLDVAVFDLCSGSVSIKKAGAAASFVKRGRRVTKIETSSLPLGIVSSASLKCTDIKLARGDMVILASDGISALSDDETERIILNGGDADKTAQALALSAAEKGGRQSEDDITVIAAQIG